MCKEHMGSNTRKAGRLFGFGKKTERKRMIGEVAGGGATRLQVGLHVYQMRTDLKFEICPRSALMTFWSGMLWDMGPSAVVCIV